MTSDDRLDDVEWLYDQYWDKGRSLRDIADETGVSDQTVRNRLLEHGLGTRDPHDVDDRLDDPDWLRERYRGEGLGMEDIAEETDASLRTVASRLHDHGIETRPPGRRW